MVLSATAYVDAARRARLRAAELREDLDQPGTLACQALVWQV